MNRLRLKRRRKAILIILSFLLIIIIFCGFRAIFFHNRNSQPDKTKKNIAMTNVSKNRKKSAASAQNTANTSQTTPSNSVNTTTDTQTINENGSADVQDHEALDNVTLDAAKVQKIINKTYVNDGRKIACLTFDDGPSTTVTPSILNVLNTYNIKATFFLIGSNIEKNGPSMDLVQEIANNGHSIGNHTYTHECRKDIPSSLYYRNSINIDRYFEELDLTNNILKKILGQAFSTRIIRMPGGHMTRVHAGTPNLHQFDQKLQQSGYIYIDWNAYDIDAEGSPKTADQLVQNTIATVGNKEKVILLMHDTYGKEETAKALPRIIEYLKEKGYEFNRIK